MVIKGKHELENPSLLINRSHPKILEMTAEFENKVSEDMETRDVLTSLQNYIWDEIPFGSTGFSFSIPYGKGDCHMLGEGTRGLFDP